MAGHDDADPAVGATRRQLLGRMAVATGVAWAAPQILSTPAASAATPTPGLTAGWVAQHSIAGSCSGITASYQPYRANDATATSWSPLPRSCGSLLVRTLYGLGSNGAGTIVGVGDQSFRVRWTGGGATMSQDSQALPGSFGVYRDVAASGTAWVAVGDSGAIARSADDAVSFSGTTSQPAGAPGLSFVATSGTTWIAGGGTIGLLWRSTDGGATWSDVGVGSTSAIFQGATYVAPASTWLAAGTLGEIWRSVDDGLTWTLATDSGADSWAGIASRSSTVVAVAAGLGRVARSTTGGASWTTSTIGGGTPAFTNVAAGPDREWMAVGLSNQIWWSDDDGASWSAASGLPSLRTWEDVAHADVAG